MINRRLQRRPNDARAFIKTRSVVVALGFAALSALATAPAQGRGSLAVATPFEVGSSLSGNYLAAIVAGSSRDTLAAATFFREALRADPKNSELADRAFVAALANGDYPDAFAIGKRVLARDPNNGLGHLTQGVDFLKAHKYAEARATLAKGALDRQHDITSTLLIAWTYAGQKDKKRALAAVDKLKDESFSVFRDYHAALIAQYLGDGAEAAKRFKASYGGERNTLRLADAYGRFLSGQGDAEGAKRVYRSFEEISPNNPIVTSALADLDAGKKLAPIVASAEEGAAEVLYGLGAVGGARQGDELASLIYLRLALALAPDHALALITLGEIYERMKQDETAIELYDSVRDTNPLRVNADVQAALLLESLGKNKEASDHLQAVVAANPKNQEALTALGNLQRSRKLYDEAVDTYTKVLDLEGKPDKTQWLLYYYRGIANERRKHWPAAESDLKKALEFNPDQPLVLNYLGYSWVDQGSHLDEAFKMLRRAVELRARDGYIVDSLGWAYYRLGRYDDAVKDLEKAIELKPSDPVINDHLGDAYWRVGRRLEARFQWNHARDLNPDPDDLPKILGKIKDGLPDQPAMAGDKGKNRGG